MLGARSPIRLTQLALVASLCPTFCYLFDSLPVPDPDRLKLATNVAVLLFFGALFVGSLVLGLKAGQRLENGIAAGRWSDEEIAIAYRWIKQPAFGYGQVAFFFFYFGAIILHFWMHYRLGMIITTILPSLAVSRLSMVLKPVVPRKLVGPSAPPAALQSSHWGIHSSPSGEGICDPR